MTLRCLSAAARSNASCSRTRRHGSSQHDGFFGAASRPNPRPLWQHPLQSRSLIHATFRSLILSSQSSSSAPAEAGELLTVFPVDAKRFKSARVLCIAVTAAIIVIFTAVAIIGPGVQKRRGNPRGVVLVQIFGWSVVVGGAALGYMAWRRLEQTREIEVRLHTAGLHHREGRKKEFLPWQQMTRVEQVTPATLARESGATVFGLAYHKLASGNQKGAMQIETAKGKKYFLPALLKDIHKLKLALEKNAPEAVKAGATKATKTKPTSRSSGKTQKKTVAKSSAANRDKKPTARPQRGPVDDPLDMENWS